MWLYCHNVASVGPMYLNMASGSHSLAWYPHPHTATTLQAKFAAARRELRDAQDDMSDTVYQQQRADSSREYRLQQIERNENSLKVEQAWDAIPLLSSLNSRPCPATVGLCDDSVISPIIPCFTALRVGRHIFLARSFFMPSQCTTISWCICMPS